MPLTPWPMLQTHYKPIEWVYVRTVVKTHKQTTTQRNTTHTDTKNRHQTLRTPFYTERMKDFWPQTHHAHPNSYQKRLSQNTKTNCQKSTKLSQHANKLLNNAKQYVPTLNNNTPLPKMALCTQHMCISKPKHVSHTQKHTKNDCHKTQKPTVRHPQTFHNTQTNY